MELKNAENDIDEIASLYKSLLLVDDDNNNHTNWQRQLMPLSSIFDNNEQLNNNNTTKTTIISASEALQSLEMIKNKLGNIQELMKKFHKRLNEKDPITNKPRYGTKTAERVQLMLQKNNELLHIILHRTFGEETVQGVGDHTNNDASINIIPDNNSVLHMIRNLASDEMKEKERVEQVELDKQKRLVEERLMMEQQILEELRNQEEEQRRQIESEREETSRIARMAREYALRAQREIVRRDEEWVASIPNKKTIDGVKEQLRILIEATANDLSKRKNALSALHTIFAQIVANPEEMNFRRIRRDHPKFINDIGQYPGGKELFIAAGFKLAIIEDFPSFYSKEPDLESDMDGWSAWFDLNRATLKLIEENLVK